MDHQPAVSPVSILIMDDHLGAAPQIHIVVLSPRETAEHVVHALKAGARGYLLNGTAGVDLMRAISAVRAGGRHLSPLLTGIILRRLLGKSDGSGPLDSLSRREREVLLLTVEGSSSAETARRLCLSRKTVETYRSRLMAKLGVKNLVGLMHFALANGLAHAGGTPADGR